MKKRAKNVLSSRAFFNRLIAFYWNNLTALSSVFETPQASGTAIKIQAAADPAVRPP
jgi:hypothetical protein